MTSWQAIRLVMGREIRERSRSGAFIFSVVMVLAVWWRAGCCYLPLIFAGDDDVRYQVGVVGDGNQGVIDGRRGGAGQSTREADVRTTVEVVPFASLEPWPRERRSTQRKWTGCWWTAGR